MDEIAKAIEALAVHVKYLGVGDAATTMGAIEGNQSWEKW